jgi:hypothetical protein
MKHYITTKSWVQGTNSENEFIEPFIPKGTAILVISENSEFVKFIHQGHSTCKMNADIFSQIPKEQTFFSDEFISEYVVPSPEVKKVKELFSELKTKFNDDKLIIKALKTLEKWIFLSKGSKAIKGKEFAKLDFENLPWVKNKGFSAKPFAIQENRSGRTTVFITSENATRWESDPYEVLPLGLKKNEHCTYSEILKISKKLFQEFSGLAGIPDGLKKIVKTYFPELNINYIHRDYMTHEVLTLDMFSKNTHHGKDKGLELCHHNPDLEFATSADNVFIGLSSSNRSQSGNSIDKMALNGVNAKLIQRGKKPITKEQLEKLLETLD